MWTIAWRSVRYSTLPALDSLTAFSTSSVTVPTFGFGILPCGPSTRPSLPTVAIISGVAIATSKSVQPSSTFFGQVLAADEVGAGGLGVAGLLALGEDGDGDVLAEPVGQRQGAAQLLLGVADVDAEQDVQLDRLVEFGAGGLLDQRDRLGRRVGAVALRPCSYCWR